MRSTVWLVVAISGCAPTAPTGPRGPSPAWPGSLRYTVPTCPVQYEVSTTERMVTPPRDAGETNGIDTLVSLEGRPRGPGGPGWELTPRVTAYVRTGKYRPFARPDGRYAPVELVTDGRRWSERGGSTMIYRAFGSQIGLVLLFPDLPESSAPGATTAWKITFPSEREVAATERKRGKHSWPEGPTPGGGALPQSVREPLSAVVRVDEWTSVGGTAAAVLSMTATYPFDVPLLERTPPGFPSLPEVRITGSVAFRGRYVLLATGRLLHATVEMSGFTDLTTSQPGRGVHTMHQNRSMHAEARLLSACDGPTERTGIAPLGREELAIEACGALSLAVLEGQRDQALAHLSPELRQAHGDDALWKALAGYVRGRGRDALPPPVMIDDTNVESGRSVIIRVQGLTADRSQVNTMTPVELELTLREAGANWRAERIRAQATLTGEELLEISPRRLFAAP